jgi:prepilin-type N-terminal cleavage/methylation domain-containing protein
MSAIGRGARQSGFTLLEMLVTLAIASLIAGIGFPSVRRAIERQEFARALADTRLALNEARALAMRNDARTSVTLDREQRLTAAGVLVSPPPPASVTLILSEPAPVFFADGTAQAAAITLRSRRFRVRLDMDRASGLSETAT